MSDQSKHVFPSLNPAQLAQLISNYRSDNCKTVMLHNIKSNLINLQREVDSSIKSGAEVEPMSLGKLYMWLFIYTAIRGEAFGMEIERHLDLLMNHKAAQHGIV